MDIEASEAANTRSRAARKQSDNRSHSYSKLLNRGSLGAYDCL